MSDNASCSVLPADAVGAAGSMLSGGGEKGKALRLIT